LPAAITPQINRTGRERVENKGLTYCASCDGPLFAGQDAVVIGAAIAGFEKRRAAFGILKISHVSTRSASLANPTL